MKDFLLPGWLDRFGLSASKAQIDSNKFQPTSEVWCTETSSTYNGGNVGLSNAYIAGFM